jgi:hydroxymethylbilane synthase
MASLKLGTRGSALALWQAHHVRDRLFAAGDTVEIVEITTTGDRILDVPLAQIGDKALFTRELDQAMLEGRIDLAVHSLKDLPTRLPDGIALCATGRRETPWDAFVAHPDFRGSLEDLPRGAVIATSSLRRQAQLKAWRPDLEIVPVRGNVDTRLRKLDESSWHGIILAAAGLMRLGLGERIRQHVPLSIMIPAVSQGALGITCSQAATATAHHLYTVLNDDEAEMATRMERAFLRTLEGGCQAPIGAYATRRADGSVFLCGMVASLGGEKLIREEAAFGGDAPEAEGRSLADRVIERGADAILREIRASLK